LFAQRRSFGKLRTGQAKRKDTFSKVFFGGFLPKSTKNRPSKAKFFPRLQKFLTFLMAYPGEKDVSSLY
jgi:excinuclease UvrABC helicase subunit UvrB